jgi:hypothetical protein
MKRAILAAGAVVLALSLTPSAFAESAKGQTGPATGKACVNAEKWATAVYNKSTGVAIHVVADIDGMEAKQVVDRVNAEPPQTHLSADHVLVLGANVKETGEPASYVLVAFFNQGCLVASGRADPAGAAGLLEGESI